MNDLYEVTWEKGSKYCHIDGIESTPEFLIQLCGYDNEWDYYDDNFIINGECIYTDSTNLFEILSLLGEYYEPIEPYDMIVNKGYGTESHHAREELNNCLVIHDADRLKEVTIKPMKAFKEDYPNYNHEAYLKIWNSINYYYENN